MTFDELNLAPAILKAVLEQGYTTPTPIQAQAIPAVLAGGGIRGGTLFGRSDKDAAWPIDHAIGPADLAATIFHALGIDP